MKVGDTVQLLPRYRHHRLGLTKLVVAEFRDWPNHREDWPQCFLCERWFWAMECDMFRCLRTRGRPVVRPDPRTEPAEYAQYVADSYMRHTAAYRSGTMSEAVYRASLYALGWRGQDIDIECRLNAPEPKPPVREKYRSCGRHGCSKSVIR